MDGNTPKLALDQSALLGLRPIAGSVSRTDADGLTTRSTRQGQGYGTTIGDAALGRLHSKVSVGEVPDL